MRIIILLLLMSCGKEHEEFTVAPEMCIESCIDRNLKNNSGNRNDSYRYCVDFVLPRSTCYTSDNQTFYYRELK